jgi:uncharacterized membrane protein YfcA
MFLVLITIFSAIIAGSGIGGGSIFILLVNAFNILDYKTAMAYNLIMFIVVGVFASINNIKCKKFDKKLFFKIIFLCLLGSIVGVQFAETIDEATIKNFFIFLY